MRLFMISLFTLLLAGTSAVMADSERQHEHQNQYQHAPVSQRPKRTLNGHDIAIDLASRSVGFVGLVAGTGLYLGLSPLTLVSQLYPPHDSFEKLGKLLVVTPAKYTFTRPVGNYSHSSSY